MSGRHDDNSSSDRHQQVVVFDLDGTLVAGDSFGAFLRHLITRHPGRFVAALATGPAWLPGLLLPSTRLLSERYLIWLAAVGLDEAAFAAAAREFAVRHAGSAAGRTALAALARVRDHLVAGDRVIIATGCAAPLAQEVAAVIGLHEVEVISSTLTRHRWALPTHVVPARGDGKLRALQAAGVPLPVDHAYSDSVSDLPLLPAARTAHVVDPSPNDWRRLQRQLGADVDVLRWAGRRAQPRVGPAGNGPVAAR